MPSLSWESEITRQNKINDARANLLAAAFDFSARHYRMRKLPTAIDTTELDDCAKALAEILNAPSVCQACGQEVPCGVDRAQEHS